MRKTNKPPKNKPAQTSQNGPDGVQNSPPSAIPSATHSTTPYTITPSILCSPAEPEPYRIASGARISSVCEGMGVDFLWLDGAGELHGVQRKQFPADFIASVHDGRLGKEMLQISDARENAGMGSAWLVLEGRAVWSGPGREGILVHPGGKFCQSRMNRNGLERLIWRIWERNGVRTEWIDRGAEEFGRWIRNLADWTCQNSRGDRVGAGMDGTRGRPRLVETKFPGEKVDEGERKKRWRSWVLQGIPGIGPGKAEKLLKMSAAPLVWSDEVKERLGGLIGKRVAEEVLEMLEG